MKNFFLEKEHEEILRENLQYQAEIKNGKARIEAKDSEINRLCEKILEQDAGYAAAARKLENENREREQKLMATVG